MSWTSGKDMFFCKLLMTNLFASYISCASIFAQS